MHDSIGRKATDIITGFAGVVTGRVEYLTGCNQLLITPRVDADGKLGEATWFDEQRCQTNAVGKVSIDNGTNPGCDVSAPVR